MRRPIEPSHLDLCYLQKPIIIACGSERVLIFNANNVDSYQTLGLHCFQMLLYWTLNINGSGPFTRYSNGLVQFIIIAGKAKAEVMAQR